MRMSAHSQAASFDRLPVEIIVLIARALWTMPLYDATSNTWNLYQNRSKPLLPLAVVDKRTSEIVLPLLYQHLSISGRNCALLLSALTRRKVTHPDHPYRVQTIRCSGRPSYHEGLIEDFDPGVHPHWDRMEKTFQFTQSSENELAVCLRGDYEHSSRRLRALIFVSTVTRAIVQETASTVYAIQTDLPLLLLWTSPAQQLLDLPLHHLEHLTISVEDYHETSHLDERALSFTLIEAFEQLGTHVRLSSLEFSVLSPCTQLPRQSLQVLLAARKGRWDTIKLLDIGYFRAYYPGPSASDTLTQQLESLLHELPNLVDLSIFIEAGTPEHLHATTLLGKEYAFRPNLRSLRVAVSMEELDREALGEACNSLKSFLSTISGYTALERFAFAGSMLNVLTDWAIDHGDVRLPDEDQLTAFRARDPLRSTVPFSAKLKVIEVRLGSTWNLDVHARMIDFAAQMVMAPTFPASIELTFGDRWGKCIDALLAEDKVKGRPGLAMSVRRLLSACESKGVIWRCPSHRLASDTYDPALQMLI